MAGESQGLVTSGAERVMEQDAHARHCVLCQAILRNRLEWRHADRVERNGDGHYCWPGQAVREGS